MRKKTTYKKLILKIILITLTLTLTIAFFYAQFMKSEAIETLTKVDAKKTTQLVFQSLYSAMEKGWDRNDLEKIIERVNNIDSQMAVRVYRTQKVADEYGDIAKDLEARQTNKMVQYAIKHDEILNIVDDSAIDYYYPIEAELECLKCHTTAQEKDVLGVINNHLPY